MLAMVFDSPRQDVEELALRASAETASRNYAAAGRLDAQLAQQLATPLTTAPTTMPTTVPTTSAVATTGPTSAPATAPTAGVMVAGAVGQRQREIEHTVRRAETIDRLGEHQQRIASRVDASQTQPSAELAEQQRDVADAIEQVEGQALASPDVVPPVDSSASADPNWRGRATASVLAAQEALAAMPQQLAAAQEALGPWREAVARAEQARRDAGAMPDPARQPAAERAAAQADRDAADAAQRFRERRRPVDPSVARALAESLEPFAPETDGAHDVIRRGLLPALQKLDEASDAGDADSFAGAGDEARRLIGAAQQDLTLAQEALTARDPLVVAKWVTRRAADSLQQTPPDVRTAQARQREAMAALSRAWDRDVHGAASLRMSLLPSMQPLYAPASPSAKPTTNPSPTTAPGVANADPTQAARAAAEAVLAPVRGWSRLRPRDAQDLGAARRETDPPGFEEPLRLYFDALGRGRSDQPK
jgi:hypothetical protein